MLTSNATSATAAARARPRPNSRRTLAYWPAPPRRHGTPPPPVSLRGALAARGYAPHAIAAIVAMAYAGLQYNPAHSARLYLARLP